MDFDFSEEQTILKKAARDFLKKECPKTLARQVEEDERGYSPNLWQKMAELGWTGLPFPEVYGGMGLSFLDLVILLEEIGQALASGPFVPTVVLGGLPILVTGTEEQKQEFLPKIARGEMILTLALMEASAGYKAASVMVRAIRDGDDYVIHGTKLFVPYAHIADNILCVTRTKEGKGRQGGISLFLVDRKSRGVSNTLLKASGSDRLYEVDFDNVRVHRRNMLGELHRGWGVVMKIIDYAAVAECALMLGGMQQVLKMTVDYAKQRVQFGRPIGGFQVIQHKCVDMATDVDGARLLTYQAAWKSSVEGLPYTTEIAMAKAFVNEAYRRICAEAHQIHGGIGFTKEHNLQLYTQRAKVAEVIFGDTDLHCELVAQQLGL